MDRITENYRDNPLRWSNGITIPNDEYEVDSVEFQSLIKTHALPACDYCGGLGLRLIRLSNNYPYFDTSEYSLISCFWCSNGNSPPVYHCEFCRDKHWIIVPDGPNDAHEEPCFCEPY